MKTFNKKLFILLWLTAALLLSGCSENKSSNNKEYTSPASVTASITTSNLSSSQVIDTSVETKAKTKTLSSKSKDSKKTISSVTKVSEKSDKTESGKTELTQKSKANRTKKNTTLQRQSVQTAKTQNVNTTAFKNTSATEKNEFLIAVEIECKTALDSKDLNSSITLPSNGIILPKTYIKVKSGQSALDITKEICEKMNISIVCLNGSYVKSIGPIGEKQCGKFSGWTYKINGKKPSKSSDKYILEDNDTLVWSFVTTY